MKADLPKIMVVDDSTTILSTARKFLEGDYQVFPVDDGYKALAAVMEVRPDLLLLDLEMPRLNGYQTLTVIRENPLFERLPIIILSAKDSPFDKARAQMMGCDAYLKKPFTNESLRDAVQRYLPAILL